MVTYSGELGYRSVGTACPAKRERHHLKQLQREEGVLQVLKRHDRVWSVEKVITEEARTKIIV